jgi:A/G-specific adenine glycosylase
VAEINPTSFGRALLAWYDRARRHLPWRASTAFYGVWIAEVMLQQTRVEAVIPYYRRFLERFPDVAALARAPEQEVLAVWGGLGYYTRARSLQNAARQMAAAGPPADYEALLALPGAGPYTAAAVASIAFNLPHAAVDGNVMRVVSRLTNDAGEIAAPAVRRRLTAQAGSLLDRRHPGDFNQAMMELGATLCLPRAPRCGDCPVSRFCAARLAGTERELPVRLRNAQKRDVPLDLVLLERSVQVFLVRRSSAERRLADFWELPAKEWLAGIRGRLAGEFSHRIVNDRFLVKVWRVRGPAPESLPEGAWFDRAEMAGMPLTTITRKALTRFLTAVPHSTAG